MKKLFSSGLFGYKKDQVDNYIQEMKKDYENELYKKRERMTELSEENRAIKLEVEALKEQVSRLLEQENCVSRALVKAEQRAQTIIEEGKRKADADKHKITMEKDKWREKSRKIRSELLAFDQMVADMMERFRAEINYYTAKEVSETLLEEEDENSGGDVRIAEIKKVIA